MTGLASKSLAQHGAIKTLNDHFCSCCQRQVTFSSRAAKPDFVIFTVNRPALNALTLKEPEFSHTSAKYSDFFYTNYYFFMQEL